mmetsp:Transcript_64967/g.174655  ORF Transcript_64967/g.174655 Transcript_64967/m.174655 type:complete len:255 (+) Transcript_64967:842-1606(+)
MVTGVLELHQRGVLTELRNDVGHGLVQNPVTPSGQALRVQFVSAYSVLVGRREGDFALDEAVEPLDQTVAPRVVLEPRQGVALEEASVGAALMSSDLLGDLQPEVEVPEHHCDVVQDHGMGGLAVELLTLVPHRPVGAHFLEAIAERIVDILVPSRLVLLAGRQVQVQEAEGHTLEVESEADRAFVAREVEEAGLNPIQCDTTDLGEEVFLDVHSEEKADHSDAADLRVPQAAPPQLLSHMAFEGRLRRKLLLF